MELFVGSKTSVALSVPFSSEVGCCTSEIAVPWNESWALIELGLWSILSAAAEVNSPSLSLEGHTTPSLSYLSITLLVISVDIENSLSSEMHIPSL